MMQLRSRSTALSSGIFSVLRPKPRRPFLMTFVKVLPVGIIPQLHPTQNSLSSAPFSLARFTRCPFCRLITMIVEFELVG